MEPIRIAHNVRISTKYGTYFADIWLSRYLEDNSYALVVTEIDSRSIVILKPTKCMVDYRKTPEEGYVWIADYSEYEGVMDSLQKLNIVEPVSIFGTDHGARFWLCKLLKTTEVIV